MRIGSIGASGYYGNLTAWGTQQMAARAVRMDGAGSASVSPGTLAGTSTTGAAASAVPTASGAVPAAGAPAASALPPVQEPPRLPTEMDLNDPKELIARMRVQYPGSGQTGQTVVPGFSGAADAETPEIPGLGGASSKDNVGQVECQMCAQRKYQDGSDDPGVSFKMPTKISPDAAPAAVMGHEQEHVVRERAEAQREGRKVVSQSVSIHTAVCPECGRVYVSGGETRTVTAGKPDYAPQNDEKQNGVGAALGAAA